MVLDVADRKYENQFPVQWGKKLGKNILIQYAKKQEKIGLYPGYNLALNVNL